MRISILCDLELKNAQLWAILIIYLLENAFENEWRIDIAMGGKYSYNKSCNPKTKNQA